MSSTGKRERGEGGKRLGLGPSLLFVNVPAEVCRPGGIKTTDYGSAVPIWNVWVCNVSPRTRAG